MRKQKSAQAKLTICLGESITAFIPKSLLKYSAMPRCCRFFVYPRSKEDAYSQRSVTDEQRGRGEKAAQPGAQGRFRLSGGVAFSSQVTADTLVARASPSRRTTSRASQPSV